MAVGMIYDMVIGVGQIQVAGNATDFSASAMVDVKDTTPVSTTGWKTCTGGIKSGAFDLTLMQDFADSGLDDTLWGNFNTTHIPKSFAFGSADGSLAYLMEGISLGYTPVEGPVGEIAGASLSGVTSRGPVVRGKVLHPASASRTSSASGTGRQLGAVIAGKSIYCALHVFTVSGTSPTLAVKLQSDDNSDFSSATDRITFSTATAVANRSQFSSVAGAITDDYWRVVWTIGGSDTPTFAFLATAGIL